MSSGNHPKTSIEPPAQSRQPLSIGQSRPVGFMASLIAELISSKISPQAWRSEKNNGEPQFPTDKQSNH